jgi:hypothetical protein
MPTLKNTNKKGRNGSEDDSQIGLFHIDFILQVCDPMFVGCPIFGAFHPVPLLNLLVFKSCIYRASKQTRTVRRGAHFGHKFELTLRINIRRLLWP